jgi:hypothetical protein
MRRVTSVLALTLATVLAACGGSDKSTAPTTASVAGVWNLQTVNGNNLPYTVIAVGSDHIEVTSDVITASSNGTFSQVTTLRVTQSGQTQTQNQPDSGTWSLNGTAVTFTFQSDGSTGTGSLSGNTLTVTEGGLALVYKKQ